MYTQLISVFFVNNAVNNKNVLNSLIDFQSKSWWNVCQTLVYLLLVLAFSAKFCWGSDFELCIFVSSVLMYYSYHCSSNSKCSFRIACAGAALFSCFFFNDRFFLNAYFDRVAILFLPFAIDHVSIYVQTVAYKAAWKIDNCRRLCMYRCVLHTNDKQCAWGAANFCTAYKQCTNARFCKTRTKQKTSSSTTTATATKHFHIRKFLLLLLLSAAISYHHSH